MAVKSIKDSKYNLSSKEKKLCHTIIHTASSSAAAVGAGLAQLPLADNAVITPIQITMIISLGEVFGQKVSKAVAKGLLGGFIANFVGRGIAQVVWGWMPGIGNVSNAITAATITESVGWLCVDHFYKEKYLNYTDINDAAKKETPEETAEKKKKCDELKKRADEFIRGEKTRAENKKEYKDLLEDFEKVLDKLDDMDELYKYHNKLINID